MQDQPDGRRVRVERPRDFRTYRAFKLKAYGWKRWIYPALGPVFIFVSLLVLLDAHTPGEAVASVGEMVFGLYLVLALDINLLIRWYRRDRHRYQLWDLTEGGIRIETRDTVVEHTWDVVEQVITRADGWILDGAGMNRMFIGRRTLTDRARVDLTGLLADRAP